jgi:hypothetical protein
MLAAFARFGERIATRGHALRRNRSGRRPLGSQTGPRPGSAVWRGSKLYAAGGSACDFGADYFSAAILLINSSTRQLSRSFS